MCRHGSKNFISYLHAQQLYTIHFNDNNVMLLLPKLLMQTGSNLRRRKSKSQHLWVAKRSKCLVQTLWLILSTLVGHYTTQTTLQSQSFSLINLRLDLCHSPSLACCLCYCWNEITFCRKMVFFCGEEKWPPLLSMQWHKSEMDNFLRKYFTIIQLFIYTTKVQK